MFGSQRGSGMGERSERETVAVFNNEWLLTLSNSYGFVNLQPSGGCLSRVLWPRARLGVRRHQERRSAQQ